MCPSLIQIGLKTAEKNSAQTNKQTNRHYENNGHLAVNQKKHISLYVASLSVWSKVQVIAYDPADATATSRLASLKSRMVLRFWCRFTQVVLERGR